MSKFVQGRPLETKAPCNVCFDLNIRRLHPDSWEQALRDDTGFPGRDHPEPEYDDFGFVIVRIDSINAAADAGCLSCELLKKAWNHISNDAEDVRDLSEFSIRAFIDLDGRWHAFEVALPGDRFWVIEKEPGRPCPWSKITSFSWGIFNPDVDQVRRFLEPKIRECLSSHRDCSSFQDLELLVPGRLPRRLIMIEDNRPCTTISSSSHPPFHLRLVETSSEAFKLSQETRYMALSHCWGRSQVIRTTNENDCLSSFKESIPWAELPLTFRDAIHVTRSLDIKFLWIDSLCIIQEDDQDWVVEGANMASTYKNAWLTIAATGAIDSSKGLFLNTGNQRSVRPGAHELRLPRLKDPLYLRRKLPMIVPWGRGPDNHLGRDWRLTERTEAITDLPLMTRAWTFQERTCSTRILHFTGDEMVFECCSSIWCECGEYHGGLKTAKQRLTNCGWDVSIWYNLATDYARRALTYETDRLPALSGVATLFQKKVGGSTGAYLAGLWEGDLFKGLHWSAQGAVTTRLPRTLARGRLPSNPPSWSWTSVRSGEIKWLNWDFGTWDELIQIVSSRCSRVTLDDDKGLVDGGCIVLRGRLCPVVVELTGERVNRGSLLFHKTPALEKLTVLAMMDVDMSSTLKHIETYFLPLSLSQAGHKGNNVLHGLVLGREANTHPSSSLVSNDLHENMYSRVGSGFTTIGPDDQDIETSRRLFEKWRREESPKFGEEQLLALV